MPPRDQQLVTSVLSEPFAGYALRPACAFAPNLDRVVACVALLGAMVLSGIVLGLPDSD